MAATPLVLIEGVRPELDGGRHAVKRVVGDALHVGADVVIDGHGLLGARLCVRAPGERKWRHVPMTYDFDPDRWHASVVLDRVGSWRYTIEAWPDAFATWHDGFCKKVVARQPVALEREEGARLLEAIATRAKRADRAGLERAIASLRGPDGDQDLLATLDAIAPLCAQLVDPAVVTRYDRELPVVVDREAARFAAWYEMFPRSQGTVPGRHGTFADAARALDRIAALGFDVVYLPPIHPVGKTFRKGPNNVVGAGPDDPGSPWAIGSEDGGHTAVEPALGTIDDFDRFVDRAGELGMEVALDYALQCSPDHPWVREHPEWFFIRPDGSIQYAENPPKKYQDIYPMNFWGAHRAALWEACRDVFLFWIRHGVRTFRVDNPHTKPLAFWEWVIAEVKRAHPDVIFLSEAFTRPKRMRALAKLGFTQSYTYFTWRNDAAELRDYLTELTQTDVAEYLRGNLFANTPDILHAYLQTGGRPAFRVRLALAATLSPLYGIYSGFELCENVPLRPGSEEYLDSEKYQVRIRDWDAPGNIAADVAALNRIRRENPALRLSTNLTFHPSENPAVLFYCKRMPDGSNDLLVAVNVDPARPQATMVHVPLDLLGLGADEPFTVTDLVTGTTYGWQGERNYVRLDPATQVAHVLRVDRRT